jgi:N-acetyl-gamma-glutamyl-phosphate reductase
LALLPLLEQDVIDTDSIIANAVSGVSGAGRSAKVDTLYAEVAGNFKAYGVDGHRHHPEIVQCLADTTGKNIGLTFIPHLAPMIRGMHATVYASMDADKRGLDLQSLYEARYEHEAFVDVMPAGSHPETRSVRGNNTCRLAVFRPGDGDRIVVLSVIDNLVKGASGQAVQNMNIMFGFDEQTGLQNPALLP